MKLRLLFAFLILTAQGYGQKSVMLKFVVDQPSVDSSTGAYYGMQFEFAFKRDYVTDNEFSEKGLFVKDSSQKAAICFKHSGNNWYIRNYGSNWQLFYSKGKKNLSPTLRINGKTFKISWKKDEIFVGEQKPVFMLKPQGFISNHQPDYFFDCSKGIIGIKTSDVTLIRADYK